MFVGAVADNFDERIEQKIFHCEIVVDNEKGEAGNRPLRETSANNRLHRQGRKRPDAGRDTSQLRPHPSGSPGR